MANNNDTGLTAAVVFAGIAVSASLVFIGFQIGGDGIKMKKGTDDVAQVEQADDEREVARDEVAEVDTDEQLKKVRQVDADFDHIRGDEDARISIIEYSDFECPFCQKVHPTLKQLVDDYDGEVNWVYRHFPLTFHEPAASAKAEAAECVAELDGNDSFWEYTDALYDDQASGDDASLIALAEKLGVNKADFQKCIEADKYADRIADDLQNGIDAGITGTPGNVIYDHKTGEVISVVGAQPAQSFKSKIDELLEG